MRNHRHKKQRRKLCKIKAFSVACGVPEVILNTALSEVENVHSRMFYRRLMPAFPIGANAAGLLSHPDNCKTPPPADAGNGVLAFPR